MHLASIIGNKAFMQLATNPKIILRYKARVSQEALRDLLALSPVWGVWSLAMIYFAFATAGELDLQSLIQGILLLLTPLFAISVCLKNEFALDENGIEFPLWTLLQLKGKRRLAWNQITAVEFLRVSGSTIVVSEQPDHVRLIFADSSSLMLSLHSFTSTDFQNFIMALQLYLPAHKFSPELGSLKADIAGGSLSHQALSFTQIWEEDMSARFASTAFVPLEAGCKLNGGRFEIVGQIAFGGLSAIYLAKTAEGICVLKEAVIPANADEETSKKSIELFAREAKLLMGLSHPKIAAVKDHFVENNHHYLALEYIDGIDLRRFVRERGPQSEDVVLKWAIEIAEILSYLHGREPAVVHRDLSPDNLMLDELGNIVLIDFGAANELVGTATGTLIGKQSYISPEQFRGKACTSSDLYSLGACMFYLLTGEDPEALAESHPREHNNQISEEMDSLISKLTSLDVNNRFASANDLIDACKSLLKEKKTIRLVEAENVH